MSTRRYGTGHTASRVHNTNDCPALAPSAPHRLNAAVRSLPERATRGRWGLLERIFHQLPDFSVDLASSGCSIAEIPSRR